MVQTEASVELAGQNVVLAYTGAAAEYEAQRRRAIVVNRSHRGRMRFTGEKAADVLTGLVTNDVGALSVGQGQYAAALTAKGRIIADLRLLRTEDSFIADVSPRARDAWHAVVRKYVNPRLAKYTDESASLSVVGIYGTQARYVVEQMTGVGQTALELLGPYAHVSVSTGRTETIVMRSPDLGVEGYDLFVPADRYQTTWDSAVAARATPAGLTAWEIARVEAGRPE